MGRRWRKNSPEANALRKGRGDGAVPYLQQGASCSVGEDYLVRIVICIHWYLSFTAEHDGKVLSDVVLLFRTPDV